MPVPDGFDDLINGIYFNEDDVRLALSAGVDPNGRMDDGNAPLHMAAIAGIAGPVLMLLCAGANVDATDAEGLTPLCLAVQFNHAEVVQLLLDHGARVDIGGLDGRPPVFKPTLPEIAQRLRNAGADLSAD